MGVAGHQLHALVAEATGKGLAQHGSSGRFNCIFYGWVIVAVCILCKIFKVQGQNNVMSYTVPHLLQDFGLSHAELGGFFSVATILAGLVQPLLGHAVDRLGAQVCIPMMQVTLCGALFAFATWTSPPSRLMLYSEVVLIFFFLRMLSLGAAETFPNTCVQQWFQRRRGRAVGVVFTFQWLGNAVIGKCVSGIVASNGWQKAALAGSAANLLLAPISATLLRRSPEACGLQPDGWTAVAADEEMESVGIRDADEAPPLGTRKIRDLWPQFAFTFFYAVMFGGSDFYMVEMVAEAWPEDLDVSLFIFGPMALTAAVSTPLVGELMDAWSKAHRRLPIVLLAAAGFVTAVATFWTPTGRMSMANIEEFDGVSDASCDEVCSRAFSVPGLHSLLSECGGRRLVGRHWSRSFLVWHLSGRLWCISIRPSLVGAASFDARNLLCFTGMCRTSSERAQEACRRGNITKLPGECCVGRHHRGGSGWLMKTRESSSSSQSP